MAFVSVQLYTFFTSKKLKLFQRFVLLLATVGLAYGSGAGYMAAPAIGLAGHTAIGYGLGAKAVGLAAPAVGLAAPAAIGYGGWGGWGARAYGVTAPAAVGLATGFAGPAIGLGWGARALGVGLAAPAIAAAPAAVALSGPAVVPAAIQSAHSIATYDVPSTGLVQPVTIDVPASVLPVNMVFRSASSALNVASKHEGAKGSIKETVSEDEPHILRHT